MHSRAAVGKPNYSLKYSITVAKKAIIRSMQLMPLVASYKVEI